jgi:hypothetical protein
MRKRSLFIALAGLALLTAAFALVPQSRPNRITRENFDRIRLRMTLSEVEAIIGPPGDYMTGDTTTGPTDLVVEGMNFGDLSGDEAEAFHRATATFWQSDDGLIALDIAPSIGVTGKIFSYMRPVNRDPWWPSAMASAPPFA